MIDILGAVYDFILEYAWRNNDVPQYTPEQIVRGWQNTGTLPQAQTEFCVITLLKSVRHGAPINNPLVTTDEYFNQIQSLSEHTIQCDFCSAEPYVLPQVTKLRADLINALCFSFVANDFFQAQSPTLKVLYADDVQDLSYLDMDKSYSARYVTYIHLTEQISSSFLAQKSTDYIRIHTEGVDAHHHTDHHKED